MQYRIRSFFYGPDSDPTSKKPIPDSALHKVKYVKNGWTKTMLLTLPITQIYVENVIIR